MSKSDNTDTPTSTVDTNADVRLTGRVKWFNNKAGFGFVTVLSGEKKDEDVFVHHSGIVVASEQYKYLVQGEYVSFTLRESDNDEHPYQAGEVRGVCDGWLMCETRNAARASRESEDGEEEMILLVGHLVVVKPGAVAQRKSLVVLVLVKEVMRNGSLLAELLAEEGFSHY